MINSASVNAPFLCHLDLLLIVGMFYESKNSIFLMTISASSFAYFSHSQHIDKLYQKNPVVQ